MSIYSIDIEADGPAPGESLYSMVAFGAVRLTKKGLAQNLLVTPIHPISRNWDCEALAVSGITRQNCELLGEQPRDAMMQLYEFIEKTNVSTGRRDHPVMVADNPGFDWAFINHYFWRYLNCNPFGHSHLSLTMLFKGMMGDMYSSFKYLRKTPHDHCPLHDAMGNGEAFIHVVTKMGLKGVHLDEE